MHIWVDADACPAVIKDILFRAAQRWQMPLTLVANQALYTPPSPLIRAVQVPRGFDVADAHIITTDSTSSDNGTIRDRPLLVVARSMTPPVRPDCGIDRLTMIPG